MPPLSTTPRRAFTVIEMVVVIAIILVLFAIGTPILFQARFAAREAQSLSNVRQILVGINAFSASNGSRLPENRVKESAGEYITWRQLMIDQGYLDDSKVWCCPLHPDPGPRSEFGYQGGGLRCVGDVASSYALNGHLLWRRAVGDAQAKIIDTVIDRPTHTILVAQTNRAFCHLRVSP
ncbi:MAG: type II secretion system protein, partial [Phycisphaerales bacterium]|nr:type II secretion system protein [Phycisphaerales bacterium]